LTSDLGCSAPMRTGEQAAQTSGSATALSTISGPMPAGSPIVIPIRGLSGLLGARVTRIQCGEDEDRAGSLQTPFTHPAIPQDDPRSCRYLRHLRFCTYI
jgi:hypothetical protein